MKSEPNTLLTNSLRGSCFYLMLAMMITLVGGCLPQSQQQPARKDANSQDASPTASNADLLTLELRLTPPPLLTLATWQVDRDASLPTFALAPARDGLSLARPSSSSARRSDQESDDEGDQQSIKPLPISTDDVETVPVPNNDAVDKMRGITGVTVDANEINIPKDKTNSNEAITVKFVASLDKLPTGFSKFIVDKTKPFIYNNTNIADGNFPKKIPLADGRTLLAFESRPTFRPNGEGNGDFETYTLLIIDSQKVLPEKSKEQQALARELVAEANRIYPRLRQPISLPERVETTYEISVRLEAAHAIENLFPGTLQDNGRSYFQLARITYGQIRGQVAAYHSALKEAERRGYPRAGILAAMMQIDSRNRQLFNRKAGFDKILAALANFEQLDEDQRGGIVRDLESLLARNNPPITIDLEESPTIIGKRLREAFTKIAAAAYQTNPPRALEAEEKVNQAAAALNTTETQDEVDKAYERYISTIVQAADTPDINPLIQFKAARILAGSYKESDQEKAKNLWHQATTKHSSITLEQIQTEVFGPVTNKISAITNYTQITIEQLEKNYSLLLELIKLYEDYTNDRNQTESAKRERQMQVRLNRVFEISSDLNDIFAEMLHNRQRDDINP